MHIDQSKSDGKIEATGRVISFERGVLTMVDVSGNDVVIDFNVFAVRRSESDEGRHGEAPRIHVLPGRLEWHDVPGEGTMILLDRDAGDFAVEDSLVIEGRGTWQVEGVERGRDGKGMPTATCGLLVSDFPNAGSSE